MTVPEALPAPGRLLAVNPVDHPGGAEVVALRLLRGLAARGWHVTATTPGGGPLADAIRAAQVTWAPLPTGGLGAGEGAAAALAWPRLRRLARDHDVILLNGTVCGRLLPGLRGLAVVSVLDVNDMVARVPRFWGWADLILADTTAIADRLTHLDPRLLPLVLGVPIELDPPAVAAPWPVATPPAPTVGFVGRFEARKGVLDLLEATPALRDAHPDLELVLVGDAPYGDRDGYAAQVRRRAAALGARTVGWQPAAPGLMRHLDVLVLPSHREPFGTVLAEAMAVGTPVVATRVDGIPEVVDDGVTGRLVAPGDPPALAAAILEVLEHRAAMGEAARAAARRYDADAYVTRVDGLLRAELARLERRRTAAAA